MMMSPSFGFGKEWGLMTCDFANDRNTSICVYDLLHASLRHEDYLFPPPTEHV